MATLRTAAAGAVAGAPWRRIALPRGFLRAVVILLLAAAILNALYYLWFRDSSLVAVEKVNVSGLTTSDAPRIRAGLVDAARGMTTLHVRPEALERAVAAYPAVRSVAATADFPHKLSVRVVEEPPVALLAVPGANPVPVAAGGAVLEGARSGGALPEITLASSVPGEALRDRDALGLVEVAAAAPAGLSEQVESLGRSPSGGVVAQLRAGPEILFGDPTRLEAKWAAAAAALADDASAGAAYVDVRLPERPAAGAGEASASEEPETISPEP